MNPGTPEQIDSMKKVDQASSDYRIHAAMVLFELEKSLGRYVTENIHSQEDIPSSIRDGIVERRKPDRDPIPRTVRGLVEETYIAELIDIALASSRLRSDQQPLERLKKLVSDFDVFGIRNAVCHPNRPFPECYWHRVAAIATDPATDALQMKTVRAAFRAACEGKLTEPPQSWLTQEAWAVPNNLPDRFDHEITGLIDRNRDSDKLVKLLKNRRYSLIAIVGPGGYGKTALCLDVLRSCGYDPDTLKWADEIVYVTAKTERLTAGGIDKLTDPVDSLEAVRQSVVAALTRANDIDGVSTFSGVADALRERRVLLCLDNLETFLRDHPEAFDDFVSELPAAWRVLVTSRIPVNSANVLPIEAMSAAGAVKLGREYLSRRGGQRLEDSVLESLAEKWAGNPLRIRLTVDTYLAGTDLEEAMRQTQESILVFSYTTLLDALPPAAIDTLECLFVVVEPKSRSEIAYLLDLDTDSIANAVSHLVRTSLVTRHTATDSERYSLSSSVRELLLRFPKSSEVRARVNARMREQRALISTLGTTADVNTVDPLAWNFVPSTVADNTKAVLIKTCRRLRGTRPSHDDLIDLFESIQKALDLDADQAMLFRATGHILLRLNDRTGAIDAFDRASRLGDPSATLTLAELLFDERNLEGAREYSRQLVEHGWQVPERSSDSSAIRLQKVHWLTAIWLGNHLEAKSASANWRESGPLRATLGCIYVTALRRGVESEPSINRFETTLEECVTCISELFEKEGYIGFVVHEAFKCLDDVMYRTGKAKLSPKACEAVASFIDAHVLGMCAEHRERRLDHPETRKLIQVASAWTWGRSNPLTTSRWSALMGIEDSLLREHGFVTAEVYARPQRIYGGNAEYLFARGVEGTEYYVARRATSMSDEEFDRLRIGDLLSVLPANEGDDDKAWPVRDALPI